jgi:hypothetical protein
MMKIIGFLGFSMICCFGSFAQDLSCADFKEGTFYIEISAKDFEIKYDIVRYPTFQEEYYMTGSPVKVDIKWIDECSYILTRNPEDVNFSEIDKHINDMGGVVVKLIRIEDDCYYFTSLLKLSETRSERLDGKICKDGI